MTISPPFLFALFLAAGLAAGCKNPGPSGDGAIPVPPPENGSAGLNPSSAPTFQPGDVLVLDVFQEEALSGEFLVSAEGSIRHPLLGSVWVKGMLPTVAEGYVERLLKDGILVNPRVTVRLKTSSIQKVVINGQINRPGVYEFPLNEKMTLIGVIAKAGGFTNIARPGQVRVVRSMNNVEETIPVDVSEIFSGEKPDIVLQPEDKIFVPETRF